MDKYACKAKSHQERDYSIICALFLNLSKLR